MEPTLVGMPLELLVHIIATYLSTKDLGALRLTSKYFETALFDSFAKEFFTKRQFMLTRPSLDVLIKISKHQALSKFVKHVIIGLERYEHITQAFINQAFTRDSAKMKAYHKGRADQINLSDSGRDRAMLAEAFRNLPNLSTLGIRDYASPGRLRDDGQAWHSYGAPTVEQETGLQFRRSTTQYASRVYAMLLQALADSDKTIPSIEVILRVRGTGLNDAAFFTSQTDVKLKPVLEGLHQLLLTLDMSENRIYEQTVPTGDTGSLQLFLQSFLLCTPSLNHLRLNFQPRDRYPSNSFREHHYEHVLEQLSTTFNLLANLKRLDLGVMTMCPDVLVQFISKFPTLRQISLWKVCLTPKITTQLHNWQDSFNRFNPWPRLLRIISTTNVNLTTMMVGFLQLQEQDTPLAQHISFLDNEPANEYSGDMSTWLPKAMNDLTAQWPAFVPDENSASDEDDEIDQEDEDDDEDMEDD